MHNFDLKNRTAIVTGGAQGFGYSIVKRFLESGAKVIIWDVDKKFIDQKFLPYSEEVYFQMSLDGWINYVFFKDKFNWIK